MFVASMWLPLQAADSSLSAGGQSTNPTAMRCSTRRGLALGGSPYAAVKGTFNADLTCSGSPEVSCLNYQYGGQ